MPAVRTLARATAITMLIAAAGQQGAADAAASAPRRHGVAAHRQQHGAAAAVVAASAAAAQAAVGFAIAQVGKPYARGGTGPESFDCSGLTYRAWARAGVRIPRTSQQQWRSLYRVPVSRLRPGDVVVYFREATHVALYIGGGEVIQATHPGSDVQIGPLDADPILGAVRV
jgi:cell wall-associated NlpC family hydrolase